MTDRIYPRIIASIWGPPKSGKSHIPLITFPAPVAAIEIGETGIEDLKEMHPEIDIRYYPLIIPNLVPRVADHEKLLTAFEEKLAEVVDSDALTLAIDSASRLWRSIRVVMVEQTFENSERQKKNRADYEGANEYMEQIVQSARKNRRLNIVFVHRHKEIYRMVEGKLTETGDIESRDYRGMENLVQIQIRTGKADFFDPKTKTTVKDFAHTIEHCRFRPELEGQVVRRLDYPGLMRRIFDA